MLGAILGDVIGSRFEKNNYKDIDFDLFTSQSKYTDDTVLTVAVADSILNTVEYEVSIKKYGRSYPFAGYGGTFKKWLAGIIRGPYNSWGNGSAMRVSPIGIAFGTLEEVLFQAEKSASITHNHPEGVKGAKAIATCVYLAKIGNSKEQIKGVIEKMFDYDLDRRIEAIRPDYQFDVSCQGSMPESIIAFLESENFEHSIRLAISIGGDSDTIALMTGAISEVFYKSIPEQLIIETKAILPQKFNNVIDEFQKKYGY